MFKKIKIIDSHVHLRDGKYESHKETIKGFLKEKTKLLSETKYLLKAVCDMPNIKPPVLWRRNVIERLRLAEGRESSVEYFLWVGLTSDISQIEEAVSLQREFLEVIGFKLYAGPTTGDLCVADESDQKKVYEVLPWLGYKGVMAVHCEKERELRPELWNSKEPWTYGLSRPPKAEIEGVKDQIKFIKETKSQVHVHFCHLSLSETVKIVKKAREQGLNVSCEITPHHVLLNENKMKEKDGLIYKVNPPLRKPEEQERLKEMLISLVEDEADWLWIATDYAPHTREEKLRPDGPSGIADYSLYIQLLDDFVERGLSIEKIERFTYHNILKAFEGV